MKLPNIRRIFVPEKGYLLLDCDLSGADAQVVAWEAEDKDLKSAFRSGLNIHLKNLRDAFGFKAPDEALRKLNEYPDGTRAGTGTIYDDIKRAVHGTNYGAMARTVAVTLGWTINRAEEFQRLWFQLHPQIREWHKRVERDLHTSGTVRNAFGYRRIFFDRPMGLLPEALAWGPQSTVAIVCSKGAVQLNRIPWVDIFLQVHDSLVFQIPNHRIEPSSFRAIRDALSVSVPYSDPLVIPWEIKTSSKSWGEVQKVKWEELT